MKKGEQKWTFPIKELQNEREGGQRLGDMSPNKLIFCYGCPPLFLPLCFCTSLLLGVLMYLQPKEFSREGGSIINWLDF